MNQDAQDAGGMPGEHNDSSDESSKLADSAAAFKENYPMAYSSKRKGKTYFGALSFRTKMTATFPVLAYGALRYFKTGYMKKFYTDDYPRASLSILSTFLIISTLLDLAWDPTLAALTDGTRTVCGRDYGRRKPFLFVASFIVCLFYCLAFAPPVSLSANAQRDSEIWYIENGNSGEKAPIFNSIAAAVWFGIFHILVKVVADATQDIPHGALLVELTPDGKERTNVWSWMEFWGCIGILSGMSLPLLGESNCASSAETGCYEYLFIALGLGLLFMVSNLHLCWHVKERPTKDLVDEAEGFVPSIVGCLSNYPFFILLLSDVVEGFGANLPLLVLPYVVDWIVGKEAAEDFVGSVGTLTALGAGVHMLVRVPMNFFWRWAAGRFGKYRTYMAYELLYGCHMFLFLFVSKGTALLGVILCGTWGMAYAGHWLLYDLVSDVADYDELLTGQRREGQLTMARELVPKICEIPADSLPFLLMGYYGYNPDLLEQNESVKWVIKGSISVLPGTAGLLGTFALCFFTLRKKDQHEKIIRGLQRHQAGLVTTDPLTGLRLPPIKREAGAVEFEGSTTGRDQVILLDHFFASEVSWAHHSGDLGKLKVKPVIFLVLSLLLGIPGFWFTLEGWASLSEGHSSIAPVGIILIDFAAIGFLFSLARLRQALRAPRIISKKDLEVMVAIHQSRGRIPGGIKALDEDQAPQPTTKVALPETTSVAANVVEKPTIHVPVTESEGPKSTKASL